MANNRLYLVDTDTYEWILLAKGWESGWDPWHPSDKTPLEQFLTSDSGAVGTPRDILAARGFAKTSFAIFTEADLPPQCGPDAWKPE